MPIELPTDGIFRGIGGSSRSVTNDILGVGIFGHNGQISSMCLDQDIPMLMSKTDMKSLGFHVHLPNNGPETVDIDALGLKGMATHTMANGHVGISLVDFDAGGHPSVIH